MSFWVRRRESSSVLGMLTLRCPLDNVYSWVYESGVQGRCQSQREKLEVNSAEIVVKSWNAEERREAVGGVRLVTPVPVVRRELGTNDGD